MSKPTVIAISNRKGVVGKTISTLNPGINLVSEWKKGFPVGMDPQASLSMAPGWQRPDDLQTAISTLMGRGMKDEDTGPGVGFLHHPKGVDIVPANIGVFVPEVFPVNAMSRENIRRQYPEEVKRDYDFVIPECMLSIGMLTVNALLEADEVLIQVRADYLPAKGPERLLNTVNKVKRQINPKLKIEGILITMVDSRTNFAKGISSMIRSIYGGRIKVVKTDIPGSIRAAESSVEEKNIYAHDPNGRVTEAYRNLTKEVIRNAGKRLKRQSPEL